MAIVGEIWQLKIKEESEKSNKSLLLISIMHQQSYNLISTTKNKV